MINAGAYNDSWENDFRRLRDDHGLMLARATLPGLATCGLGPQRSYGYDLNGWARYHFPDYQRAVDTVETLPPTGAGNGHAGPRFLVAGQEMQWEVAQLRAFGCTVVGPKQTERHVLTAASAAEFDAAVVYSGFMSMDAAIAVTDWFHERGKPYVFGTSARYLPPSIEAGGIVFRFEAGGITFRQALLRIKRHFMIGCDFDQPDYVDEVEEGIDFWEEHKEVFHAEARRAARGS